MTLRERVWTFSPTLLLGFWLTGGFTLNSLRAETAANGLVENTMKPSVSKQAANNATVLSIEAPKIVIQGAAFSATVTIRNTGSKAWTSTNETLYRLGAQNATDQFWRETSRLELPHQPVLPGDTVSFSIECRAPLKPGHYPFTWRMVEEFREWFGDVASTVIFIAENKEDSFRAQRIPHYKVSTWQREAGLPEESIRSALQTRDGYLWMVTERSLARFDGARFTVFNEKNRPELKNFFPFTLFESKDGSLWIGTFSGGLVRFHEDSFTFYSIKEGLAANGVRSLCETRDGSLWIGTTRGLNQFKDGRFKTFTHSDGLGSDVVKALVEAPDGTLYVGTSGGACRIVDGMISRLWKPEENVRDGIDARTLHWGHHGRLWIGTAGGVALLHEDRPSFFTKSEGLCDNFTRAVYEDSRGTVWVGTADGLCRLTGGQWITEKSSDGIPFNEISSIFEDLEGNIWIGSKDGLHRLTPASFTTYTTRDGLSRNNIMAVLQTHDDAIWATTLGGGVNQFKNGKFTTFAEKGGLPNWTLALSKGRDGGLWIGQDYYGIGLIKYQEGKVTVRYAKAEGLNDNSVRVIYEDRGGQLWVGTRTGLYIFRDGKAAHYSTDEGLIAPTIRVIFEDHAGTLWIGTGGGVNIWKENKLSNFSEQVKALHCPVVSFYEDSEQTLWIGTLGQGLYRWGGGRLTAYTSKQGLFSDDVHEILEDDQKRLWISCRNGIFRLAKKNLDDLDSGKAVSIQCAAYGKSDGLLTGECNIVGKPSACKARDGKLYFATAKGLSMIDPAGEVDRDAVPPAVVIEEILMDKNVRTQRNSTQRMKGSSWKFPPGRGELEFHYTALSFTAPEKNRFKFKLEGYDSDWVDAVNRRVAYYNNLKPGDYIFQVIACNNDGVWNLLGANVKFTLQPHYWQTWWFKFLVIVAGVSFVGSSVRYATKKRMQLRLQRLEQQHAIEKERSRIAQDMHDDLGSRLTEILLLSDAGQRNGRIEGNKGQTYSMISTVTRDIARNLDALVWSVNPVHDGLDRMALYLCDYVTKYLSHSSVRCELHVQETLPSVALSSVIRHQILSAVKEALNNVIKHSGASRVQFYLQFDHSILHVRIEDNGKGFFPDQTDAFGNGLANMKKRMEGIGGIFEMRSEPGKGTRIELKIPLTP